MKKVELSQNEINLIDDYTDINDETGFANGEKFSNPEQVHEYFTVDNMIAMFGSDYEWDQNRLNSYAIDVIENRWHCDF